VRRAATQPRPWAGEGRELPPTSQQTCRLLPTTRSQATVARRRIRVGGGRIHARGCSSGRSWPGTAAAVGSTRNPPPHPRRICWRRGWVWRRPAHPALGFAAAGGARGSAGPPVPVTGGAPLHGLHERAGSERDRKWWAAESGDEKIRSSRGRQKILVVGPAFMGACGGRITCPIFRLLPDVRVKVFPFPNLTSGSKRFPFQIYLENMRSRSNR
jgi:hypothetical protein